MAAVYGAGSPSGGVRRLGALGRRSSRVLVLSALTGLITGTGVALFDWITRNVLLARVQRASTGVQPAAPLTWMLRQALAEMQRIDVDELAVLIPVGGFVGIVSSADILRLDEILHQATEDRGDLGV